MEINPDLKLKLSILPESPGVYRYFDRKGKVIYVGKAKNLKRRVNSYFNRVHPMLRTSMLVRNIWDLKYVVVNSEEEALDLENSLIKEYKPHYNVLLKDDKSYPWICVTKELYPRVFLTHDRPHKGGRFFGPYPKVEVARAIIDVITQIFPIRSCRHNLTVESVQSKKVRLCLQYHIKRCLGCCQDFVSPEKYGVFIEQIIKILRGDTKQVSDYLIDEMGRLAGDLKFEEAHETKQKYHLVEQYRAKSVIVNPSIHNVDVFSIIHDDSAAYVNYLHVREGAIVQSVTFEYKYVDADADHEDADLLSTVIREIHDRFPETYASDKVTEVIVNVMPYFEMEGMEFTIPYRGGKRKLLAISLKNAEQYKIDKYKRLDKLNPEQRITRLLTKVQKELYLPTLPHRIECFDNSNTSGLLPVASCVVFRDGKPSKRDYRRFIIKTVVGPDDYASMKEVLTRRYTRLLAEGEDLPQLVVLDGGKGQLNAALSVFEDLGLRQKISVIGIAKRMNEIFFPGDAVPLFVDKNSETLRLIQRLRDEAHRFAIAFHRYKRGKTQVYSELDDIPRIGPKTKTELLKHFKSLRRIKAATLEELTEVVGAYKAQRLTEYFKAKEE